MTGVPWARAARTTSRPLLAGARSVYGIAADGVLPPRLARLSRTRIPLAATLVVLAAMAALVTPGDLSAVARLTDAMVLISFIAVNLSLAYLGVRGRTPAHGVRRAADVAVPALGAALCGGLLVEGGWTWIAAAGAVAGLGAVLATVSAAQRSEPR